MRDSATTTAPGRRWSTLIRAVASANPRTVVPNTAGRTAGADFRAGELLDRWVEAYALSLSATLHLGYYRAPEPSWWQGAGEQLRAGAVQLGGEAAAGVLDDRLRPVTSTLYAAEVPVSLLARYRCRRAEAAADANVIVRRRFWTCPEPEPRGGDGDGLVPVVLIYADLLVSGEPRQREHAHRLRTMNDRLTRLDGS